MVHKNEDQLKFHTRLLADALPELHYRLGGSYHDVVKKCLKGSFGDDAPDLATDIDVNKHQLHSRRCFLTGCC